MKYLHFLSLVLLLQGCGGEEAIGPAGNVKDFQSYTQVMSAFSDMNNFVGSDPTDVNGLLPGNVPTFSPSAAPDYSGCKSFVIGSALTDDHYRVEYNCRSIPGNDGLNDNIGYIEQDIEDRNQLELGYRSAYDMHHVNRFNVGTYMNSIFKSVHNFTRTSNKYIREYDFTYAVEGDWEPVPVDYRVRRQTRIEYTPSDMNDFLRAGQINASGVFEISGLVGPDGNGRAIPYLKFGLSYYTQNLTYDNTCASTSNLDGTIVFMDGANNKIEVVYVCSVAGMKIYLNGVEQQSFFNP